MNSTRLIISAIILLAGQSCSNNNHTNNIDKGQDKSGNKYVFTLYQDKFDQPTGKFKPNNVTDTLYMGNDTVAYLNALKKFYDQKIIERKKFNYGQPKSFTMVDKNGSDLGLSLPRELVNGLKQQVESTPEVKNMIEEYKKDSL